MLASQLERCLCRNIAACSTRNVIQDYWYITDCTGNRTKVFEQSALRRLVVVWRDQKHPVDAKLCGRACQLNCLIGYIRASTGNNQRASTFVCPYAFNGKPDHGELFIV